MKKNSLFLSNIWNVLQKSFYRQLLVLFFIFFTFSSYATIYYVSSSGSDSNSGTSASTPWKSLTKVNGFTPRPGDQILFKRGDSWNGSITVKASGTSGSPITYGAYGTGEKPKIYGSEVISGWTLHSGKIYKASFSKNINQLFLNNSRMKAARYPNTGYALISSVNTANSFTCDALNGSIDYKGAIWVGRTIAFATVTLNVTSSYSKTLTLSETPYSNLNVNEGFILVNKLEFLDSPGEWYYDGTSKIAYFWTPNGDTPNNYIIRGSTVDNGIVALGKSFVTIKDFDVLNNKKSGIVISGNNINVDNNTVSFPDSKGIDVTSGSINTISNNSVTGANHTGIFSYSTSCIFSDNKVNDTFLFNNIGITGGGSWYMGSGIYVEGNDNLIKYNRVINAGYCGIAFSKRNTIEFNFVNNVLLTKDDGGGIYSAAFNTYPNAATAGSIIRYNIVDGVFGTLEGWSTWIFRGGHGIFLDENAGDVTIEHNTVANCSHSCVFLHLSFNETIRNNTLMSARRVFLVSTDYGGTQFTNNIVYAKNRDIDNRDIQWLISKYKGNLLINNNTYIDHYNSTNVFRLDEVKNYDFNGWKAATGQDVNSTIDITALASGEKEELFYNDTKLSKTFDLGSSVYRDIFGAQVKGTLTLAPFTSKILIKTTSVVNSDVTKPSITGFTIPATSSSLTAPVSSFTATDNVAVTGFKITETATTPNAADAGWYTSAPASYSFATEGIKTLYAWVKDAAGNISSNVSQQVTVTVTLTSISSTTSEYLFEESSGSTVIDSKGPNNGTIINSVPRVAGIRGGGLQFTGSGYVNLGKSFGDNVQDEITLSAWIKPTATGGWQGIIMHGSPSLDNFALYINSDLKKIVFRTRNTAPLASQWTEITNTTLWDGNWHQVTATYNGSQKVIYIDGVAVTTVSAAGVIESGVGYDLIVGGGREYARGGTLYKGLMDEVRIYNYGLSGADNLIPATISSTTSEYLLEEPTGLTVIDSKGANNGTIINSVQRVAGIRGGGLQFTGSGYVNLGKSFGDNVQDEITLSAWIKPTATGGWQGIIMHGSPSLDNFALYINSDLKKIVFRTRNTAPLASQWTEITNITLWDGNWHQVTATYNGSQKVIYIDGVAITTVSAAGVIESGDGYSLIVGGGREYAWGETLYKGLMDEVRIYNYGLSGADNLIPATISSTTSEYLLEEPTGLTVIDSKGANNGTIINSVQRVAGIRGGGLQFTGSGYVNLGKSFGDNVQDEITLSAWIKPTATGGWQGIIMHGSPSLDNFALYINSDLKKIVFRTRNTESVASQWTEITNTTLWDGNWHQVTATYNGSQKVIYIDGVAVTTVNAAGVIESGDGYSLIVGGGREYAWGGTLYKGLMDEVRIFNYGLTGSEVNDLFNNLNSLVLKDAQITKSGENNTNQVFSIDNNNSDNPSFSENQLQNNDFKLYPNPAKSFVNVDFDYIPEKGTTIEIIDGIGRTKYKKLIEFTSTRIETDQLTPGIYIVRSVSNKKYKVQKLIVE